MLGVCPIENHFPTLFQIFLCNHFQGEVLVFCFRVVGVVETVFFIKTKNRIYAKRTSIKYVRTKKPILDVQLPETITTQNVGRPATSVRT